MVKQAIGNSVYTIPKDGEEFYYVYNGKTKAGVFNRKSKKYLRFVKLQNIFKNMGDAQEALTSLNSAKTEMINKLGGAPRVGSLISKFFKSAR